MYTVEAVPASELGNSSFLVADTDNGVGFVVDPLRDIERYLHLASKLNIKLTHSLDTHLHNDFVSGRRELAAEVGANIDELEPGRDLTIGSLTVHAIHTPGHTPEHKSFLLSEGGKPRDLFSGGAVMLGAIARTDLFGPHLAVHLAFEALTTLQARLRGLPDDIRVFPTHGGGSFCAAGGGSGHETTLGTERRTNPFFLTTEVMPFLARALNQPRYPTYYRDMSAINRGGAPLIGTSLSPLTRLGADEVARMMDEGAAVVDVRPGRDYDRGHIPGSYNIGIDGPVSAWVGWLIDRTRPLVRLILNQIGKRLTESLSFGDKPAYRHRLLFMLDEFPSLGRLDFFQTSLAYLAGYGIKAYLATQDREQMFRAYGEHQSITGNCHIRIVYAPNEWKTAEWVSRMTGNTLAAKRSAVGQDSRRRASQISTGTSGSRSRASRMDTWS